MVEADVFSADSLKAHFQGHDVVMSCLGFSTSFFSAVTGYTLSMTAVVNAMKEAEVNRVIAMTSWYTERESNFLELIHIIIKINQTGPWSHN